MTTEVLREQDILSEAAKVLIEHLEPEKVVRFWASWQVGKGDYLQMRQEIFQADDLDALYKKALAYQKEHSPINSP